MKAKILVVDDAPDTLEVIERHLSAAGYSVITVPGVTEAVRALEATGIDLVITDQRMPKASGMQLIKHVRQNYRNTEVIMLTGYASVPNAVEAMQSGAYEYLSKPFTEQELLSAVSRAMDKLALLNIHRFSGHLLSPQECGLIGNSKVMQKVYRAIDKAAGSDATVLVSGESGTGKELVARAVHYNGHRRSAPFVPVNCGGIPDGLLESELFGYRKGAFTGAHESRAGFFQTAAGGSIFLDEIAELGLPMQAVLLRVLQDKTVFSVGSRKPAKVDVRIIAATNKKLGDLAQSGHFREDLYYRINVIPIELPPLRERGDDILLLINSFVDRIAKEQHKTPPVFTDSALRALRSYPWPGNVRELENVIQRLLLMADGECIDAPDLPELMRYKFESAITPCSTLSEVEQQHIAAVLTHVNGNKSQAAAILGIDRKTLRRKLEQHGEKRPSGGVIPRYNHR